MEDLYTAPMTRYLQASDWVVLAFYAADFVVRRICLPCGEWSWWLALTSVAELILEIMLVVYQYQRVDISVVQLLRALRFAKIIPAYSRYKRVHFYKKHRWNLREISIEEVGGEIELQIHDVHANRGCGARRINKVRATARTSHSKT
jgi:hypothetical protein